MKSIAAMTSEKQEEYKAKHPRGSKRNEWSVQG